MKFNCKSTHIFKKYKFNNKMKKPPMFYNKA